jgi:phosphate transport system protein
VRLQLQQSLSDLKERLLVMAGMAEQAIQRAVQAYRTRDISVCDLMDYEEQAIDHIEREIDQMALDLLAMEHPVATDLRFTLAVIKINADLERIGNAASSISHRVRDLETFPVVDLPVDIPRMASLATGMVRNALLSFIEADADLAQSVLSMDDTVGRLNDKAYSALSSLIERQPELIRQALNAIMIARSLERVADQSKNVAADVIFWVRGADLRQHVQQARAV